MAKNKTIETTGSVKDYLNNIPDADRRNDCSLLIDIFKKGSGYEAKMWGTGIVGFGSYHYKYESGREGDAPIAAFSSRKNAIVLYLINDPAAKEIFLKDLGKHKTGKGCIYLQKCSDVNLNVLEKMIKSSIAYTKNKYEPF